MSRPTHAVGLGPKDRLGLVCGNDSEIVREIEASRAVKDAAVAFDQPDEFHLAEVFGSLEHQVFEQMSKPRPVLWLDAKTDVVVNGHGHKRRRMLQVKAPLSNH